LHVLGHEIPAFDNRLANIWPVKPKFQPVDRSVRHHLWFPGLNRVPEKVHRLRFALLYLFPGQQFAYWRLSRPPAFGDFVPFDGFPPLRTRLWLQSAFRRLIVPVYSQSRFQVIFKIMLVRKGRLVKRACVRSWVMPLLRKMGNWLRISDILICWEKHRRKRVSWRRVQRSWICKKKPWKENLLFFLWWSKGNFCLPMLLKNFVICFKNITYSLILLIGNLKIRWMSSMFACKLWALYLKIIIFLKKSKMCWMNLMSKYCKITEYLIHL
jgi:hypothetical protein